MSRNRLHSRRPIRLWPALACLVAAGLVWPMDIRAQASGAPTGAGAAVRPIPPVVMSKLLEHIASDGRDTTLPAPIAGALDLAPAGQPWPNKQFAVRSQGTGLVHAVAVGARPDSDLILSSRGDAAITVFHVRRNGELAGAVYYFPETQSVAVAPAGEAAHDFDDERVFWQRTIDAIATEP